MFKIFVANPKKTETIQEILYRNKDKLIAFLRDFQKDREDEQFADEKNILLHSLESLAPPPAVAEAMALAAAAAAANNAGAGGAAPNAGAANASAGAGTPPPPPPPLN